MQFIILMCCVVSIIISVLCLTVSMKNKNTDEYKRVNQQLDMMSQTFAAQISTLYDQLNRQNNLMVNNITALGRELRESQETQQGRAKEQLVNVQNEMKELRKENWEILDKIREDTLGTLDSMRKSNWESLEQLRNDNQKSLDKINDTVNEKLQKTLDDKISQSFEAVNKRLAEVYEGLGEMKKVASGVTDLKNVLSNVKTRGIMGEIQLASILSEILAPEQFAEQVVLVPGKNEKVDFAVKLPGASADKTVYLPIDSKFPGDTYANLMSAYENGDVDDIKQKRILLVNEIKKCAKSIHDKYIIPPYTTKPAEPSTAFGFFINSSNSTITYKSLAPRKPETPAIMVISIIASSRRPSLLALYSASSIASMKPIPIMRPYPCTVRLPILNKSVFTLYSSLFILKLATSFAAFYWLFTSQT